MRLCELIDNLSLESDLDPVVTNREIIKAYSDQDLVTTARQFLRGIGSTHGVPADVVLTLSGIQDYWQEHEILSPRQRVYVIQNLIRYWSHMGVEMRAVLML